MDKVSTEIRGLSSTDCNFQGLSRCVQSGTLFNSHVSSENKSHPDPEISQIWLGIFAVCNFSYLEIVNMLLIV